jgi:mono/diheme cytochrome c family protein
MNMKRSATVVAFVGLIVASFSWILAAQHKNSIWDGVYTAAQAERGRVVIQNHCSECHHEDLSGGEGPALVGDTFMLNWETHSLERLFHKIRDTMPGPGSDKVTNQEKLDTVAYLLQQNGFPAGATELTDNAQLANFRIVSKNGPTPPRAGAMVQAIGCLEEAPAGQWTLSRSTDPQVMTMEIQIDEEVARTTSLGHQNIGLLSVFPSPAAYSGHKVAVKGLLIRHPAGLRINVLSLESVAPTCP